MLSYRVTLNNIFRHSERRRDGGGNSKLPKSYREILFKHSPPSALPHFHPAPTHRAKQNLEFLKISLRDYLVDPAPGINQ